MSVWWHTPKLNKHEKSDLWLADSECFSPYVKLSEPAANCSAIHTHLTLCETADKWVSQNERLFL